MNFLKLPLLTIFEVSRQITPYILYMEKTNILSETALKYFNINYLFPYQRLVITNILEAAEVEGFRQEEERNPVTGEWEQFDTKPHQIVILPTGAGKSLCFMLPVPLLNGPTLVIFPLLSLIADQARRLIERGFNPAILRGGQSKSERQVIWNNITSGKTNIILSNPETILQNNILMRLKNLHIAHLVIDEMHIVSEWGDTFRPSYLEVGRIYKEADIHVVTAFTATASPGILSRVREILFPDSSPAVISANPDRPNIHYRIIRSISKTHDLVQLITGNKIQGSTNPVEKVQRPILIFNRSRTGAYLTARYLRQQLKSENIFFYHAGLSKKEKTKVEQWYFHSNDGILCSTCAYGLGVDKGNIRTVIHIEPPPSVEAYLQESGRGGRDRKDTSAILLVSESDFIFGKNIQNTNLKNRYLKFLLAVTNNSQCRRKSLLTLLGSKSDSCSGCDVCDGVVQKTVSGYTEITDIVKKNNRKLSLRETLLTLAGKKYHEVFQNEYYSSSYYNTLHDWSLEEIKEGIIELKIMGILKIPKRGLYKQKIIFKKPVETIY